MSDTMADVTAIIFAFIAYIGWGVGDMFGVVAARKHDPTAVTFWSLCVRALLYTAAAPFFIAPMLHAPLYAIAIALCTGIASGIGYYFFIQAAVRINPTLVVAIAGAWSALAVVLSIIFLHEQITPIQTGAILVIFCGLLLLTLRQNIVPGSGRTQVIGYLYAVLAMIAWSICGSFIKIPIVIMGWFWPTYFLSLPVAVIIFILRPRVIVKNPVRSNAVLIPIAIAIASTIIAEISYNIGIGIGAVAVIAPIAGSYATFSALLSVVLFREPLSMRQRLGVVCTLIGIVVLAFVSI